MSDFHTRKRKEKKKKKNKKQYRKCQAKSHKLYVVSSSIFCIAENGTTFHRYRLQWHLIENIWMCHSCQIDHVKAILTFLPCQPLLKIINFLRSFVNRLKMKIKCGLDEACSTKNGYSFSSNWIEIRRLAFDTRRRAAWISFQFIKWFVQSVQRHPHTHARTRADRHNLIECIK